MGTATCARVFTRYPPAGIATAPGAEGLVARLAAALDARGFAPGAARAARSALGRHDLPIERRGHWFNLSLGHPLGVADEEGELELLFSRRAKSLFPARRARPRREAEAEAEAEIARALDEILKADPGVSGVLWYENWESALENGRSWGNPEFEGAATPPEPELQRFFRKLETPLSRWNDRIQIVGTPLVIGGGALFFVKFILSGAAILSRIGGLVLLAGVAILVLSWCLNFIAAFACHVVKTVDSALPVRSRVASLAHALFLAGFAFLIVRGCAGEKRASVTQSSRPAAGAR